MSKSDREIVEVPEEVVKVLANKETFRKRLKDKSKQHVKHLIYGRTLIIVALLIIQLYLFLSMVLWIQEYSVAFFVGFLILELLAVIDIMNSNDNPSFKLAWLILVLILPVFGTALYVFVKNQFGFKVHSWRNKILKLEVKPYLKQKAEVINELKNVDNHTVGTARYVSNNCGHPIYEHTNAIYFPLGENKFQRLLVEISKAKKFIFLEYFIIKEGIMWDSILEILKKKAEEGVEVRVMYDGLCTFTDVPSDYHKKLLTYGIKAKVFAPMKPVLSTVQNNRDHRKIAVIDGKVAFTGGVNLADEYINEVNRFGHWKDAAIMLEGEAVRSFTLMFLTMWNIDEKRKEKYENYVLPSKSFRKIENDGYILPYSDCPFDEYYVAKHLYMDIINTAEKYVYVMTPYLILDNETTEALCFAAARGVEVKIILPHIPDKKYAFWLAKSYYEELLEGGVQIYEYLPGFVHAKVMISDHSKAVVGSSNLDFRSYYLHYECGVYVYNNSELHNIYDDFKVTLSRCKEVQQGDYDNEPLHVKCFGHILRLVAPLM